MRAQAVSGEREGWPNRPRFQQKTPGINRIGFSRKAAAGLTEAGVNIPNALSLLRVFLVAPFLIAVIYRLFFLALIIFVVAGVSDFLDGYLARHLGQKSVLGSFLDPLGDRLLTTVAFVALGVQELLPAWLAVTVVAKDLYVALGAGILHFAGHLTVAEASSLGKLTTLLQIITVAVVLISALGSVNAVLLNMLFAVTALVTIFACFHYIWQGLQVFTKNEDI
jgi:cardiolipin synthase